MCKITLGVITGGIAMNGVVDYWISAVSYNPEKTHIDQVKIHPNNDWHMGDAQFWLRTSVVNQLKRNVFIKTVYMEDDSWKEGAKVIIDPVGYEEYIKTVSDNTTRDNLGKLDEY